jgi:predicted enzyme related to lactoylglutathione lyase
MAPRLLSITVDAENPTRLAEFWAGVTGYEQTMTTDDVARIEGDGTVGPGFMFIRVPEGKTAKNRMHIDLGADDLDAEVDRVVGLGAVEQGRHDEWGITWATLADPEGNEFCIALHR